MFQVKEDSCSFLLIIISILYLCRDRKPKFCKYDIPTKDPESRLSSTHVVEKPEGVKYKKNFESKSNTNGLILFAARHTE